MMAASASAPGGDSYTMTRSAPAPLAPEAFHGPMGAIVQKVEKETEADVFSILGTTLAAVGNIMGRNAYVIGGNDRHYPVLFVALVGQSAKSRKGTSWSVVEEQAKHLDADWCGKCVVSGLSTGEGLIWAIRDPIEKREPIKERGRITDYQTVVDDPGVSDKRLLVNEGEFSRPLRAMQRDGNNLSSVMREAWDCRDYLRVMSKSSPAVASKPHISIVAHTTHEELRGLLSHTDTFNGFANRFLWGYVRRSRFLPEGGKTDQIDFSQERAALQKAVELARRGGRRHFDAVAQKLWNAGYIELSEGSSGVFGAATNRSEAQVLRLALLYALADGSDSIKETHLRAALAVWRFCAESADFLFGEAGARSEGEKILAALRARGEQGASKTDISKLFNGHESAPKLKAALASLKSAGLADVRHEETGGRTREVWFAITREEK